MQEAVVEPVVAEPIVQTAETLTIEASPVRANYDKFSTLRSNQPIKDERPLSWTELLMGESIPTEFESMVDNWLVSRGNARKRLGSSSASKVLDSVDGTMWTGKVGFGSEKQEYNLMFDTASDWTVVDGIECGNCMARYDPTTSTMSNKIGENESARIYGEHKMMGYEWTDQVCVTESACIKDFEFFLVHQQDKWLNLHEKVHGILGLSRDHAHYHRAGKK